MQKIIFSLLFISTVLFVEAQPVKKNKIKSIAASTSGYKVGVKVSYVASGESFVFTAGQGRNITVTQSNMTVNFPGSFTTGQTVTISQLSGPRTVNFTDGSNIITIPNSNVVSFADAGSAPGSSLIRGILKGKPGSLIKLQLNGGNDITLTAGAGTNHFTFSNPLTDGSSYTVTIKSAPPGEKYVVRTYLI
jgi:hypothetical protein